MMNSICVLIDYDGEFMLGINEIFLDALTTPYNQFSVLGDELESCWGYSNSNLPSSYRYLTIGEEEEGSKTIAAITLVLLNEIAKDLDFSLGAPRELPYTIISF